MKKSTRLALAMLSTSALLAACDQGIVDPRSSPGTQVLGNAAPIDGAEPIDGGGGGGGEPGADPGEGSTTPEPYNPPPPPFPSAYNLPLYAGGNTNTWYNCVQVTHAYWGLPGGYYSNQIPRGTTVYPVGIVVPGTRMNWAFYDQAGQLVKTHLTQTARSNCVVHYEPEGVSTWDMAPGYYYLYSSYNGLHRYDGVESSQGVPLGVVGKFVGVLRIL